MLQENGTRISRTKKCVQTMEIADLKGMNKKAAPFKSELILINKIERFITKMV